MKIVAIEPLVVNADMRNWIFVKVRTDQDGLYGWGEATLEWKTRSVIGALEDITDLVIGRDPRDIEHLFRLMVKRHFWNPGVIGMTAISAIEIALWDIMGKSLGVPVWRLLGGKVRDRVKVYSHLGMGKSDDVYNTFDVERLVDSARALMAAGYRAMKVVFVPYTHYGVSPASTKQVGRLMAALREAVGDDVDLMVDFHGRCPSVSAALAYIEELRPHGPLFVEEPLPPGDVQAYIALANRAACPIATGERLIGRQEFEPLLRSRAINIVQPDICHCGGLLEAKKIAAAAETASAGVAPHNPLGPIAGAAALHFAVSTPNFLIQEEMVGAVPIYRDVVSAPTQMVDSHWSVPELPGLGVEVDEALARRHPYRQEPIATADATMSDGTVVDW
jgi:galactonate dehydratase